MLRAIKKPFSTKTTRIGSTRWVEAQLDDLTRRIWHILEHSCFTCGSRKDLQVGHLVERRHRHCRWDTHESGAVHLQCGPCNALHESKPEKYINMFTLRFSEQAYADILGRAHSNQKITYSDLLALLEEKQEQLDRLKGKRVA
jgi:hypothetical protein